MSDTTKISVTGNCGICQERVTWTDDATEQTVLVCKKCGATLGTYGDFKRKAIEKIRRRVVDSFKKAFKRR